MEIERTKLDGVAILTPKIFNDLRGQFIKVYNEPFFPDNDLSFVLKESYYSTSHKDVLRGMHFQTPPQAHTKIVYVTRGSIADVILDIRKGSPTYGEHISVNLSEENRKMVYIPAGFAHGFLSLADNSCVVYMQTTGHSPENDAGIRYDSFGMDWGVAEPIMSDRDRGFVALQDYDSPFVYTKGVSV